jgi:hypothetical protein
MANPSSRPSPAAAWPQAHIRPDRPQTMAAEWGERREGEKSPLSHMFD